MTRQVPDDGGQPDVGCLRRLSNKLSEISLCFILPFRSDHYIDITIVSFVYLYLIVSFGLVLGVTSYARRSKIIQDRSKMPMLDIYCLGCMVISCAMMLTNFFRKRVPNFVQFIKFPRRYYRPFVVALYFFGTVSLVFDVLTIVVTVTCAYAHILSWIYTFIKMLFTLLTIIFINKFATASFNESLTAKLSLIHVIATYFCILIRIPLSNSRPRIPESHWFTNVACDRIFTNPTKHGGGPYIISYDSEFILTAMVFTLMIWLNMENCDASRPSSSSTSMQPQIYALEEYHLQGEYPSTPREPNIDVGLIVGLTFGAILSLPYTFMWQNTIMTDKQLELFVYHLGFVGLMLSASALALVKISKNQMAFLSGINFPCTLMIFFLFFFCCCYAAFSILAATSELIVRKHDQLSSLMFANEVATFIESITQTFLIAKFYICFPSSTSKNHGNVVKQCSLFLMVCNLVQWIHMVYFDLSHRDKTELQEAFYGRHIWRTISKTTYPFCMYYRLFSTFCLFEISFMF